MFNHFPISSLKWFLASVLVVIVGFSQHPAYAQWGAGNPSAPCNPWPQCAAEPQGQGGGNAGRSAYPSAPAPPTHRWVRVSIAVARHPDANDVWAIWDTEANIVRVEKDVVSACNQVMGNGCTLARSGRGGTVAVAHDQHGAVWAAWGDKPRDATMWVLKYCADAQKMCTVIKSFTATHWQKRINGNERDRLKIYLPDFAQATPRMAVIAWPKEMPKLEQWRGKAWLSTGIIGMTKANQTVIDQCARDSGVPCIAAQGSMGGTLIRFSTNRDTNIYWASSPSRINTESYLKTYCKRYHSGATCTQLNVYDSQTSSMTVIE